MTQDDLSLEFKRYHPRLDEIETETAPRAVTRGKEYLTSDIQPGGTVTVFGAFWWPCPVQYFAGEEKVAWL